jgi:hypothetical protein
MSITRLIVTKVNLLLKLRNNQHMTTPRTYRTLNTKTTHNVHIT